MSLMKKNGDGKFSGRYSGCLMAGTRHHPGINPAVPVKVDKNRRFYIACFCNTRAFFAGPVTLSDFITLEQAEAAGMFITYRPSVEE